MTKSSIVVLLLFILASCSSPKEKNSPDSYSIIPKPVKLVPSDGVYKWNDEVIILTSEEGESSASFLSDFFKTKNIASSIIKEQTTGSSQITLSIQIDSLLKEEGYSLVVNDKGVL